MQDDGDDPDAELLRFLGEGQDVSTFWRQVKTNLQAGRVRLLFIADEIPPELRRVVEFLNSQMDPAEVLAIEVKQFLGESLKTLVPRVLGQTETARQKKIPGRRRSARKWDELSFFADLSRGGVSKSGRRPATSRLGKQTRSERLVGSRQDRWVVFSDVLQQARKHLPVLGVDVRNRGNPVSIHEAASFRCNRETEGTCRLSLGHRR